MILSAEPGEGPGSESMFSSTTGSSWGRAETSVTSPRENAS